MTGTFFICYFGIDKLIVGPLGWLYASVFLFFGEKDALTFLCLAICKPVVFSMLMMRQYHISSVTDLHSCPLMNR